MPIGYFSWVGGAGGWLIISWLIILDVILRITPGR
jgi:hypothetical protein